MKILVIHNYYRIRSGEDLAFDATVSLLRAQGHDVHRIVRDNRNLKGITKFFSAASATFSVSSFFEVLRMVKLNKPEVALVQNVFPLLSPSVYLALKFLRVPVVQRVFNYRMVCTNGILYTKNRICERCSSGAYWNAVRFACYRESRIASFLLSFSLGFWRSLGLWRWGIKQFLVPDQFLGDKILPAVKDASRMSLVFNPAPVISEGTLTESSQRNGDLLFVGRLVRPKGIFTMLEIAKRLPDRRVLIVGTGEDEHLAKEMASSLGLKNVSWRGATYGEELQSLLNQSGVLVIPSEWYDNAPLILTQGLLSGIPIVASRINGIPEFVVSGQTGRLAEPGNPESFVNEVNSVFEHPVETQRMLQAGLERAKYWFSSKVGGKQLEKALLTAISS